MSFLESLKRPWESQQQYKARTMKGAIQYIIVPQPEDEGNVDVFIEGSGEFDIYKNTYQDRIVEIPTSHHLKSGGVNWDKVDLLRDEENPRKFKVILTGD